METKNMKSLTNATIIQTGKSKRIKPKQFNHSNIKARDDFKSNAVNGVKLRKKVRTDYDDGNINGLFSF